MSEERKVSSYAVARWEDQNRVRAREPWLQGTQECRKFSQLSEEWSDLLDIRRSAPVGIQLDLVSGASAAFASTQLDALASSLDRSLRPVITAAFQEAQIALLSRSYRDLLGKYALLAETVVDLQRTVQELTDLPQRVNEDLSGAADAEFESVRTLISEISEEVFGVGEFSVDYSTENDPDFGGRYTACVIHVTGSGETVSAAQRRFYARLAERDSGTDLKSLVISIIPRE